MGGFAPSPDPALSALSTRLPGLPHPPDHPRDHLAGFAEVSSVRRGPALLPSVGDGTRPAQFKNHPQDGAPELQNSQKLGTRNSPALPDAQSDPPTHVGGLSALRRPTGAGEFCRQFGRHPSLCGTTFAGPLPTSSSGTLRSTRPRSGRRFSAAPTGPQRTSSAQGPTQAFSIFDLPSLALSGNCPQEPPLE